MKQKWTLCLASPCNITVCDLACLSPPPPSTDVPAAPGSVCASDVFKDSCILSWTAPPSDGGSPLTGYHIERRTGTMPHWIRITTRPVHGTSYKVEDLKPGTQYEFRVIAENRVGQSQNSIPCQPITAKDPWNTPSAPGEPAISDVTKRSCTLTWQAPALDGGDPIRNYVVEYRVAGTYKWLKANPGERTLDTTYKVTGLDADLEYEFRVGAENKGGIGAYSETTLPVRAQDPEVGNKPTILSPLHDVTVMAGKTVKLECDVTVGKPEGEIRWWVIYAF